MTMALASLAPPKPVATERLARLPIARPKTVEVAAATPKSADQPLRTASAGNLFDSRGLWQRSVDQDADPAAQKPVLAPFEVASAVTGSTDALAYAAESKPAPRERIRPMGKTIPQIAPEAAVMPASANTSVVTKASLEHPMTSGGQRPDSPWMRAAMLTPSVSGFMTATRLGDLDPRPLQALIHKPAQSVMMTFSADQALGMVADRFTGPSVVFLATATFTAQTTASLR
jgi:hypothetical protein